MFCFLYVCYVDGVVELVYVFDDGELLVECICFFVVLVLLLVW